MPRKEKTLVRIGRCTIRKQPGGGWRASVPRPRGQGRIRKRFRTLSDAQKWVRANLSTVGVCDPLTPKEAVEYRDARALLPPGASIVEAAKAYSPVAADAAEMPLRDAVAEFIQAKTDAGRRPDTIRDYRQSLDRLPACTLGELSTATITASIEELNPRRRNNVLATISTFCRWCIARRYLASNPAASIDKVTIDWTPPKIYTPAQTSILFALAEESAPRLVPVMALCAFAGIRTSGAVRLSPSAIDFQNGVIEVVGFADKLRRGYLAPLSGTLRKWLEAYPFKGWSASRRAYEVSLSRFLAKAPFPAIRNGFRHSYASYLYAKTQDARAVASALGHLGEVETLTRSYRRLTSPALAEAYFSIHPTLR